MNYGNNCAVIVKIMVSSEFKILLWQELWQKLSVVWEDLPIQNSWESVLDKGVFEGTTNWQIFGSRKPLHEAYELKYFLVKFQLLDVRDSTYAQKIINLFCPNPKKSDLQRTQLLVTHE